MNIHEYQAKALLHEFGVPISKGTAVLRACQTTAGRYANWCFAGATRGALPPRARNLPPSGSVFSKT